MEMSELVSPTTIAAGLAIGSKKKLLRDLSERLAETGAPAVSDIFEVLTAREKLGTTGVGGGVAIPHGKMPGLDRLFGYFATLRAPVDFDATDGAPVDLVFVLLVPEDASADHLKALARISRTLRNTDICARLRAAKNAGAVYSALIGEHTN